MATGRKRTRWESSLEPEDMEENRSILDIRRSRFPLCTISGNIRGMPVVWTWKDVTPSSIEGNQLVYDIEDWVCLSASKLSTDRTVPEEVTANIVKLVRPLQSLYFDSTSQLWDYKENCDLTPEEQTITQGFVAEMASSRGRGMCAGLMTDLFASESSMKVVNIGGNSTANEPAVRDTLFRITFEGSDNESSSSESPAKLPPESLPLKRSPCNPVQRQLDIAPCSDSKVIKFVPDIVLESVSKEHLVIEVKKGRVFHQEYISQLRFMLMPAALHQRTSVGVLISAKNAVLEKCIASNGIVSFQRGVYKFEPDSLVAGMQNLLKDIYCNIV
ncbi:uncharacterized protein [Diadema setosum]|uniref:uncharacterized protein n=1 Tax=Diadema setosum TaxID=31175 RepID=UPI003B3A080C